MTLTRLAKLAILEGITIKYDPQKSELIIPIDTDTVWSDGFQSISEHHEVLMELMADSDTEISEHKHNEMRFKNGKE